MTTRTLEYRCKCDSCKGTGIYVGIGERDGAGVVCFRCKGSGAQDIQIKYEDFEGRVERHDVERVFECNPGICIGSGGAQQFQLSDFGGMAYADWAGGRPFERGMENRRFTCPQWWYQTADYRQAPDWDACSNESLGRPFSNCPYFPEKETCWARFDQEAETTKNGDPTT